MAERILMLALSPTMDAGVINKWSVAVGETVGEGDVLCEVETDKAVMEYESPVAGTLLAALLEAGDKAAVGSLIAIIGKKGEDISSILPASEAKKIVLTDTAMPRQAPSSGEIPRKASPSGEIPRKAPSSGEIPRKASPSGETPRQTSPATAPTDTGMLPQASSESKLLSQNFSASGMSREASAGSSAVSETQASSGKLLSSPLARKLAQIKGVPLQGVKGSGPFGRIVKRDIESAPSIEEGKISPSSRSSASPKADKTTASSTDFTLYQLATVPDEVIPVSGKRRVIANRLSESMYSAPHYYLKKIVEVDALLEIRSKANSTGDKLSFNAFLIRFAAEALKRNPIVNSSWKGDTILRHGRIDIGLAVAQTDGLITPVIRSCASKGIRLINSELSVLVSKARANTLQPAEYMDATFTISNLGSDGIDEFTAIINPPASAILAVGQISRRQKVGLNDSLSIVSEMTLTLSCDHRVIDGAVGAAFMKDLAEFIQNPAAMLL